MAKSGFKIFPKVCEICKKHIKVSEKKVITRLPGRHYDEMYHTKCVKGIIQ